VGHDQEQVWQTSVPDREDILACLRYAADRSVRCWSAGMGLLFFMADAGTGVLVIE
jgi:hypothetical protein